MLGVLRNGHSAGVMDFVSFEKRHQLESRGSKVKISVTHQTVRSTAERELGQQPWRSKMPIGRTAGFNDTSDNTAQGSNETRNAPRLTSIVVVKKDTCKPYRGTVE